MCSLTIVFSYSNNFGELGQALFSYDVFSTNVFSYYCVPLLQHGWRARPGIVLLLMCSPIVFPYSDTYGELGQVLALVALWRVK